MSGTKSPSPKAQAINTDQSPIEALIVSHGQPSDPEPAEAILARYTAGIQADIPDHVIESATLAAPGRLEKQLDRLVDGGVIYPLFMADGWFVRTALIKRISGASLDTVVAVMPPFGLDVALPGIVARNITDTLSATFGVNAQPNLLVAAHGSAHGTAPAASALLFAERLRKELPGVPIEVGFIEQDPSLGDVAATMAVQTICLPFFAMPGEHVRLDIPAALKQGGFSGPVLPPVSQLDGAAKIISNALSRALNRRQTS